MLALYKETNQQLSCYVQAREEATTEIFLAEQRHHQIDSNEHSTQAF
jgi:hypothetical protein